MQFKRGGTIIFCVFQRLLWASTFNSSLFLRAESKVMHGLYWKSAMLLLLQNTCITFLSGNIPSYIIFVQSHFLILTPMYIKTHYIYICMWVVRFSQQCNLKIVLLGCDDVPPGYWFLVLWRNILSLFSMARGLRRMVHLPSENEGK